ncbi:uncharacterized protein LOC130668281 isoform X2 [Microplitis mediator]|uniref:uncharacterized protein LOC130668281 isoform X2 n=1 Tax=Microplitis mediator TaxID=375433 RepID=UPI00255541EB|nr:uncharacterized protein LOC130668281 isoform X2 [Microplitis mediator]
MYLIFIFVCVQILAGNIYAASVPTDKIREEPTKCPEYPDDFTQTLEFEEKNYRDALAAGNLAAISPKEMERRATCVYQHLRLINPDNSGDLQAVLSFLIITNPIIKDQIPFPEEKLENLKRCLAKKSDSADEARAWIDVCIKENFPLRPSKYEPEVADECPEYPENKSMREILKIEEENYQAAIREKNFAAISQKEMQRRATCVYQHLGLIKPDNSGDLQAVLSFLITTSPIIKEQIPFPEEKLGNLKRCLAKKSDSADEARDWILVCVQENFRLVPLEYESEAADKCPEYPENKSMKEIVEIEERKYQTALREKNYAAISKEEMERTLTCLYKRLGLINPDNSGNLQAVMSFFSVTSPIFTEQLPAPEETLENLKRCLARQSDSADEAKAWILACVKANFRLHPVGYKPIVENECPEYPESRNLSKILEIEEINYQLAIKNKNFAAISDEEMARKTTCIYQHMGLIKPDNSADLQAVINFFSKTSPIFREQIPVPEEKLEKFEGCLAKKSDSAEEAKDWILVCIREYFRLYPIGYELEVGPFNNGFKKVSKKCPEYPDNLMKILEIEEKYYQSAILNQNFKAISEKEMDRRVTCIYQHMGLINPDNSGDLQAVMSYFSVTNPNFKEQLPAPEKKIENLKRCLAKKSDSADEAKDWILVCVRENFRLYPLEYEPEVKSYPKKHINSI